MNVCFLLDENLDPRLKAALLRRDPTIDVLRVGEPSTPELGTLDPDILRYLAGAGRALSTIEFLPDGDLRAPALTPQPPLPYSLARRMPYVTHWLSPAPA